MSTVGEALADRLGWLFIDGDSLHPAANIAKMSAGAPLTDQDRLPWLRAIGDWMDPQLQAGQSAIVACSGLKRGYRDLLLASGRQHRENVGRGAAYRSGPAALAAGDRRLDGRAAASRPVADRRLLRAEARLPRSAARRPTSGPAGVPAA